MAQWRSSHWLCSHHFLFGSCVSCIKCYLTAQAGLRSRKSASPEAKMELKGESRDMQSCDIIIKCLALHHSQPWDCCGDQNTLFGRFCHAPYGSFCQTINLLLHKILFPLAEATSVIVIIKISFIGSCQNHQLLSHKLFIYHFSILSFHGLLTTSA